MLALLPILERHIPKFVLSSLFASLCLHTETIPQGIKSESDRQSQTSLGCWSEIQPEF